ncbi:hypothetical protein COCCADRAFT_10245 [Bipolaris zeicola 26-R-13]|uniref:RNase III domain-containing protein n=1 Tax=Cochliobolus carbonum (strain 26-R-13) TaxID=930089 RepID=W6XIX7_COCC2|nr:uncharacterized protein COCCADRAFT_10245 [Bipolaris zeicola 26-R-13]EUC27042.1 hypothetical protein COCCADRAFT_10245 [Bipolaris zeicola 26-R-13]
MASISSAQAVENIISYNFQHGYEPLCRALTAAGVQEEDWDGNRKLAQFGTALSEFILSYLAFEVEATRANVNDFKKSVANNEHCASIARRTGISGYIRFADKDGAQSPSVHAKAINAIIAAVFFDSGRDIGIVARTMLHLGLFNTASQTVDPSLLSLNELPESVDVGSLARSLFNVDAGNYSSLFADSSGQAPWTCSWRRQHGVSNLQQPPAEINVSIEFGDGGLNAPTQPSQFSQTDEANIEIPIDGSPGESSQIVNSSLIYGEETSRRDNVSATCDSRKTTKKRTNVHQAELRRRRKLQRPNADPNIHRFGTYAREEERASQSLRPITPQDVFLTPVIQQEIQRLCKGKIELFEKILTNIGSPCLIGGLQDILRLWRAQESRLPFETTMTVSRAERVRLIDNLDHTTSYFKLLQRHHIVELFEDCSGPGISTLGVLLTSSDFSSSLGRPGNPVNKSVADLTARMMQEMYPSVKCNTSDYEAKYRRISYLRRLGQRLHLLETKFGKGVLGIMLDRGFSATDVGITDAMIMTPTDAEYAAFVEILDKYQGALLRSLSMAVSPVVQALTAGDISEQRTFAIENMTADDITNYQKGSPAFLQLICRQI